MKRTFLLCTLGAAVLFAVGSRLIAYSFNGPRWGEAHVPFYVNPANNDISQDAAIVALQSAAAAWSSQSNAGVELYYAGRTTGGSISNNGRNEVFFRNETNGSWAGATYYWYDGSGRITDADMILYDGAYRFYSGQSGCSGSGIYVEDIASHEFGHFLGLNHSSDRTATMYPTMEAYCHQGWRTLESDDRAGIEAMYPSGESTSAPPAAPSNLTAASSNQSVGLSWSDRATNEDGFTIERSTDSGAFTVLVQVAANATWFSDSTTASGRTYAYRLRAWNESGSSSYSNVATVSTPAEPSASSSPSAPTLLSPANGATGTATNVTIAWATASGATGYDVYFGTTSNPPLWKSNLLETSVNANKLSGGKKYYWRVVGKNSAGQTTSATWSFTTGSSKGGGKGNGKGGGRRK